MKNVTITEISGDDVDFDQTIDSDTVTALAGGVAVMFYFAALERTSWIFSRRCLGSKGFSM